MKRFLHAPVLAVLLIFLVPVAGSAVRTAAAVRDADGNPIPTGRIFSRIISLYPAHTRNLSDMGGADQIVAVGRSDGQLPDRPRLGYRDDPERFLALRPDLVLIRPMISRAYPALVGRLRQSGVSVVSLQPAAAEELFSYWRILGRLSGHGPEAEAMIRRFTDRAAALERRVRAIAPEDRPRVYFEAIHRRMKTFAPGSLAIYVLEAAGGVNVARDAVQVRRTNIAAYGKERILARAGEIDVYLAQRGRMNPVTVDEIRSEPGFSVIRALRNNRVYLVDEKIVARPTMDLLEGMTVIHGLLYGKDVDRP